MDTQSFFNKDYANTTAADLLKDEAFIAWVKYGNENQNLAEYWKVIIHKNPGIEEEIGKARGLIKVVIAENEQVNSLGRDESWSKITRRISATGYSRTLNLMKSQLIQYRSVAALVGTLLLIAGALWTGYNIQGGNMQSLPVNYTTIYSPAGQKTEITLPDSSKVWLNSKTTIRYTTGFNVDNRNIYLEGEAFFDVVKGTHPFEVKTEAINIKVLGTEFNIKCYREEEIVEATLVKGSMIVERTSAVSGSPESILLKPNQKIVFSKITDATPVAKDTEPLKDNEMVVDKILPAVVPVKRIALIESYDTKKSTGWVNGLLYVEAESLLELSRKLERRYDVQFVFMNDDLKDFKYTGTLREYSLEQVLNVIQTTSPVKYRIDEQVVYIGTDTEGISNYLKVTKERR